MINPESTCKKIVDSYIKWVHSGSFADEKYGSCWIDIENEITTILEEYKIEILLPSTWKESKLRRYLVGIVSEDERFVGYIDDCVEELMSNQRKLVSSMTTKYTFQYIDKGYLYRYNIRPIGYMAIYFFGEKEWYKCRNESDYFNLFKQCVRYDFKTSKDIKKEVLDYKKQCQDVIDVFSKELKHLYSQQPDTVLPDASQFGRIV